MRADCAGAPQAYGWHMTSTSPHRVVIAGGGIGGLEAMFALRELAGDRVAVTLVTPDTTFHVPALSVEDPFGRASVRSYELTRLCAEAGAELVVDTLAAVEPERRAISTAAGAQLTYDDLLVTIGARRRAPFATGITFRGLQDAEAVHGLVQDVELGYTDSVAFVVPTGAATWPLPLYELALLTAARAFAMGTTPTLTFVTPEERPLGAFGIEAGETVRGLLADAGIDLHTETHVRELDHGAVVGVDGTTIVTARRIVTIPLLEGPHVAGLPSDPLGFIPVDDRSLVVGFTDIWAVGDATSFPLKQGGVAAQHAGEVATAIAARAGAPVEPSVAHPTLGAKLFTGARPVHLGEWNGDDAKVATRYLGPVLARLDRVAA
jgi:sulfide:quinone oxidoreductase